MHTFVTKYIANRLTHVSLKQLHSDVRRTSRLNRALAAALGLALAMPSFGDEPADIVKQSQNPVASLISVPIQNNLEFGVGPKHGQADVLDIEPVIPMQVSSDWNIITRAIVPVIYEPYIATGIGDTTGTGDMNLSMYLSPAKTGALIWGVGPSVTFPTASDRLLGQGKYAAGLSGAVLTIRGPWVLGVLVTDVTSIGGESDRKNVHQMLVQPFGNYNFAHGWYLASSPMMTADWKASATDRWTVPIGGGGGRLFFIGNQAINASMQAFGNVLQAHEAGNWTLQMQLQFLFPR